MLVSYWMCRAGPSGQAARELALPFLRREEKKESQEEADESEEEGDRLIAWFPSKAIPASLYRHIRLYPMYTISPSSYLSLLIS